MNEPKKINLQTICGGAAFERFDYLMKQVLENIADPNTETDAKRSITARFTFKPDSKGRFVDIQMDMEAKLAPNFKGAIDSASIGMDDKTQEMFLYTQDVRQQVLPMSEPTVTEIRAVSPPVAAKPVASQSTN